MKSTNFLGATIAEQFFVTLYEETSKERINRTDKRFNCSVSLRS
jgi:hypothetical protein